ncbi:MAG TPA: hypothetical protein VF167_13500 [Longimicrobiaceae bacterium]
MSDASVLPYRTDALALSEWLEARARGRSAEQLRSAADSPKAVEGTAAAAAALGFVEPLHGGLTALGEQFALGGAEERRRLLRRAVLAYPPYREVIDALADRGQPVETEVRWIEAFWATRGHGGSESNRREGAAAFGRLVDFAGLGEYVQGRRGRPTRIRWVERTDGRGTAAPAARPPRPRAEEAPDLFDAPGATREAIRAIPTPSHPVPREFPEAHARPPARPDGAGRVEAPRSSAGGRVEVPVNRITVPLSGNAAARIEVPLRLPSSEKRRLLDLLELLISEE